jgi:hypothetical protein
MTSQSVGSHPKTLQSYNPTTLQPYNPTTLQPNPKTLNPKILTPTA